MRTLSALSIRLPGVLLLAVTIATLLPLGSYAQLSQNSGVNSADTWVTFDLTSQTQVTSSSLTRPAFTQTYHVEVGYDTNGKIVVNLWPTGIQTDSNDTGNTSVIRLSSGNMVVFDQNGVPVPYVPPVSNVSAFNPLSLLGTNPGSSVLSQLVVSNIQQQAQTTNSQLSYSGPNALLVRAVQNEQTTGNAQWTYVPSGSLWLASQVSFSLTQANFSTTRTLQFSNLYWNDNASNDTVRKNQGSTALNPPPTTTSLSAALSPSTSSTCVPYETNLGGSQNVVFQHGIFSNACTWWRMEPWLNQYFRWGIELAPTLNSGDNLTNQGNALVSDINSVGGTNYILIGHSQGGLISRFAAQHYQSLNLNPPVTRGVLTLDTPHQGAPLAAIPQGLVNSALLGDMDILWGDVGCGTAYDNWLCYLIAVQYSGLSEQLINIGALTDLVPGSAFLTNLNSQSETFQKAAVIGNTDRRWIEVRIGDEFLFSKVCNPEDWCGERNFAAIYGYTYDAVQISWDIAEFDCLWTGDPTACSIADYLLPIWIDMDIADLDYNLLSAGGNPQDGLVPSGSQNYPSSSATQYPVSHADSHMGATRSDRARNALEQALVQTFQVPTQASCSLSISPTNFSTSSSTASTTFNITAGAGCQWSAVSNSPWVSITSVASGTSNGSVSLSILANPSSIPRSGTITIASATSSASSTFTVQQAGVCTYALSAYTVSIPSGGGSASVTVYAPNNNGCVWSAVPNATWITITNGASGTATGSFTVSANANPGDTDLIGTVTVMSQTLTVILGNPVGSPGRGSLTINGSPKLKNVCNPGCTPSCARSCVTTIYESGDVIVTIAGDTYYASYSGMESATQLATTLAGTISAGSLVSASASGTTITLTAKVNGVLTNYGVSTSYSYDTKNFTAPAFTVSGSSLTGGTD